MSFISLFIDYWLDYKAIRGNSTLLAKNIQPKLIIYFRPLHQDK